MKYKQTYRLLTSIFLATLIAFLLIFQSAHRLFDHCNDNKFCDIEESHIHTIEHADLFCFICLFQIESSELDFNQLTIKLPEHYFKKADNNEQNVILTQSFFPNYLRGPPSYLS